MRQIFHPSVFRQYYKNCAQNIIYSNLLGNQLHTSLKLSKMKQSESSLHIVQQFNPTLNKFEWTEQPENYDYYQEIARSAYADMLHDHNRNIKYFEALKIAIELKRKSGEEVIVLDIGTGTGLLSMMAAKLKADKIYACEAFSPMAECAGKIMARNNYAHSIKLIPKRSTELTVGPGKDLDTRANILITEVFDTELIGEGAIDVFNHAHEHLLTDGCIVIPQKATIYAQVVDCSLVSNWNAINAIRLPNNRLINFPTSLSLCAGAPSVQDLQLSQIKTQKFTEISEPIPVFEFDWNEHSRKIETYRVSDKTFTSKASGVCNTIFTWWDLQMDSFGVHEISCRPEWSCAGESAWRDHWMQSVYYLPESFETKIGQALKLASYHDEFSLWYNVSEKKSTSAAVESCKEITSRPICTCGVHTTLSRTRIGMLNDTCRNDQFIRILEKFIVTGESVILCLSEGSVLPLIAASLGAKKVFVIEEHTHSARILQSFVDFNHLQDKITILNKRPESVTSSDLQDLKIHLVIGDPYFHSSIYPWNNLYFWYAKKALTWSFDNSVKIIPSKATLKGIAVNFDHLWKIKAPVCNLEPFQFAMEDFDNLILPASDLTDCPIDAQPLWEYKGLACSEEFDILSFELAAEDDLAIKSITDDKIFDFSLNGIALWMEWHLDNDLIISNGPVMKPELNHPIEWDLHSKQGVVFSRQLLNSSRDINIEFDVNIGDLRLSFGQRH